MVATRGREAEQVIYLRVQHAEQHHDGLDDGHRWRCVLSWEAVDEYEEKWEEILSRHAEFD